MSDVFYYLMQSLNLIGVAVFCWNGSDREAIVFGFMTLYWVAQHINERLRKS